MLTKITVRRPRGVVPKVTVRRRTVVEYQPSWLLLAVPVAVVAARRKRSRAQISPEQTTPVRTSPGPDAQTPSPVSRRKRAGVLVVRLARLRRRPGLPPVVEHADVVVPVQTDSAS